MSKNEKKKRKPWKIILFSFLGMLAAIILTAAGIGTYFYFSIKNFDPKTISEPREKFTLPLVPTMDIIEYNGKSYKYNDDIVNILFIGVDEGEREVSGIVASGGQADTLMLLSIDTKNRTYFIFNILRDAMTEISVFDLGGNFIRNEIAQIALAHHYGDGKMLSAHLTEQAVSNLLYGLKIYRFVRLNIKGIPVAADLFGGVTVTLEQDMRMLGENYKTGEVLTMNGEQTEFYVRNRDTNVLTSSMERSDRQMRFLQALFPQIEKKVKKDPLSVIDIYNQLGKYVQTNMSIPELSYVLGFLNEAGFNVVNSVSLPGEIQHGERFAEFIVDNEELYDIMIGSYYHEIQGR